MKIFHKEVLWLFFLFFLTISSVKAQCPPNNDFPTMSKVSESMMPCDQKMVEDLGPNDANYDLRFINRMIPHHEQAVKMAKNALAKANHPQLKQMAQDIISAQEREINQLKTWRKEWYHQ